MSFLKKIFSVFLVLSLLWNSAAAAGDTTDPVISQSYLESVFSGAFLQEVSAETKEATDTAEAKILQSLEQRLAADRMEDEQRGVSWNGSGSLYISQQDTIYVALGTKIVPTDGELRTETSGWVDLTQGQALSQGSIMAVGHCYINTDESGRICTLSAVGSMNYRGAGTHYRSGYTDYASRAQALAALGLFQGSTTGFELNREATRTEALVMFLRVLGLESEAQGTTDSNPFWDIPSWASSYAAYAYTHGLVQGRGNGSYDANSYVTAQDYITFLLRSLGYQEGKDFWWATALDDALRLGFINESEYIALQEGSFTRAHMVYLSWCALMTPRTTGQLLLCWLRENDTVSRTQIAIAIQTVCGSRGL